MPSELRKAIFLDRDGVINQERGQHTWLLEDFKINPGVVEALSSFQSAGFLLIVISNQSGIARGLYELKDVEFLHAHLSRYLANHGIRLAEIYYCPHHPSQSRCLCRKPDSLMIEKALARFDIDPKQSWLIGDAERDVEAGNKAGVKSIRITPNESLLTVLPAILK